MISTRKMLFCNMKQYEAAYSQLSELRRTSGYPAGVEENKVGPANTTAGEINAGYVESKGRDDKVRGGTGQ